jgi:GT2 family glycosyltransferase
MKISVLEKQTIKPRIAKGKYFLLLNPDTIVREETFEKNDRLFESHDEAGIAGCKVLNPDGLFNLHAEEFFRDLGHLYKSNGFKQYISQEPFICSLHLTYLDENKRTKLMQ